MIYFDNSATTPLVPAAKKALLSASENWGNPSSLHALGLDASIALDEAREVVSRAMGCRAENLFFTHGGTEANNIAIFGAAMAKRKVGRTVVLTVVEHPSVRECFKRLELLGFEVKTLSANRFGQVDLDELANVLSDDVVLVSMMAVNNELGTVTDIKKASAIVRKFAKNALFHSDFVQGFLKASPPPALCGVDLASVSSHKVHGAKGAGALFAAPGVRIVSPICGGGQEGNIAPGTEPTPAIFSFAAAVESSNREAFLKKTAAVKASVISGLSSIPCCKINSPTDAAPNILNFSLEGYPSEVILNYLSSKGICVSAGSACSKGKESAALSACGLEKKLISSAIRVSFSELNTEKEAEIFIETLKEGLKKIRPRA